MRPICAHFPLQPRNVFFYPGIGPRRQADLQLSTEQERAAQASKRRCASPLSPSLATATLSSIQCVHPSAHHNTMDWHASPSLAHGVNPTAPYTRAPSPPYVEVPSFGGDGPHSSFVFVPHFGNIDAGDLTEADLQIITQGQAQSTSGSNTSWKYEHRREAQPILDFIYLGPSSSARNGDFLRAHGITMVLACKDSKFGAPMLGVQKVVESIGIAFDSVDISPGNPDLVASFPIAVRKINDHLLNVYRQQALSPATQQQQQQQAMPADTIAIDQAKFRRGKVLVCCETGNGRSAAIVAAYIMAMLGAEAVKAMSFVLVQRFSAGFDDESKNHLLSFEDLLTAKRDVARQQREQQRQGMASSSVQAVSKRRIDDVGEDDLDMEDPDNPMNRGMAPFTDTSEWGY